jgi:hypothetical protein
MRALSASYALNSYRAGHPNRAAPGGRERPAMPQFGVVVDTCVADRDSVVLEGGSHDESVRLATKDRLRVADAQVADIHQD